jgi:hypothetical protein
MSHPQTVEFLRRRYAAAILRDDADTAGRLRAQLDGIMNHARRVGRCGEAPLPEAQASSAGPPDAPARPQAVTERSPSRLGPRLCLVPPVTGLLERPARRLVIASSRDPGGATG